MSHDAKTVKELAKGRWRDILVSLGGVPDHCLVDRHGPCPNCAGNDRFRFDDKAGDGTWFCNHCGGQQGNGGGGDGFLLIMRMHGWPFFDTVNAVGEWLDAPDSDFGNIPRKKTPVKPKEVQEDEWFQILPVQESDLSALEDEKFKVWNPKKKKFSKLNPVHIAQVRNIEGVLQGLVVRVEIDGKKIPMQVIYAGNKNSGEMRWIMQRMEPPRTLYGAHKIGDAKKCIVVLGEKKRDLAQELLPHWPVLSIIGGDGSVVSMDWTPLFDKTVLVWPDNDESGWNAAQRIASILQPVSKVVIVRPPSDKERGWDLGDAHDEGWTSEMTMQWIRDHKEDPGNPWDSNKAIEQEPEFIDEPLPPPQVQQSSSGYGTEDTDRAISNYIRFLGFDHEKNFYYSYERRQIIELSSAGHTKANLILLAPEIIWLSLFPAEDSKGNASRSKWSVDAALDHLNRKSVEAGHYDARLIRKSGCWWDNARVVMHLGSHLLVDGIQSELSKFQTKYIYEARPSINYVKGGSLTKQDAQFIESVAKSIRWKYKSSAFLALGWTVLAPVCGLLSWRPHMWVTGGTGSGKSTIMSEFIKPLLGNMSITPNGSSTEAGVRQSLNGDALPVIIDEAEGNDARAQDKIQKLLELARVASCDSSATVSRGTASGQVMQFNIRSMFAFSAIQEGIKHDADRNRIVTIELKTWRASDGSQDERARQWAALEDMLSQITPEMGMQLISRTMGMVSVVMENIEVFKAVLAKKMGSQRLGDTYGSLMAGWWSLLNDEPATEEQAFAVVDQIDWDIFTDDSKSSEEAEDCLATILQTQIRAEIGGKNETPTLGELVSRVCKTFEPYHVPVNADEQARLVLARHGIRVDREWLVIANKSINLAKELRDTNFAVNWHRYLMRIEGAQKQGVVNFGGGLRSRTSAIPISKVSIKADEQETIQQDLNF